MSVEFPLYRKYPNNKSYFKVLSHDEFEEIQILGSQAYHYTFKAKILPDRNLVADMIDAKQNWVAIEREEYEEILEKRASGSQ
jgi:hypothetical protein